MARFIDQEYAEMALDSLPVSPAHRPTVSRPSESERIAAKAHELTPLYGGAAAWRMAGAIVRGEPIDFHGCKLHGAAACSHPPELDHWYHGALSRWRWSPGGLREREPLILAAFRAEQRLIEVGREPREPVPIVTPY